METSEKKQIDLLSVKNIQKTKIVVTIGPASSSKSVLKQLILAGVDVFRLNFSHGKHEEHLSVIKNIKELNDEMSTHISMLADLQGPKIRIGEVENNAVQLIDNQQFVITTQKCIGNASKAYLSYENFPNDVKVGELIMIDDGKIVLEVLSTNHKDEVNTKILHGGKLSSRKGVNLPNTKVSIPSLTDKDKLDVQFAIENNIDWIGLSFVRNANDIIDLRSFISERTNDGPLIIAKIEKPEAIADLDRIVETTDGVMVARGDLGVEMPIQKVPLLQKQIVNKCLYYGKPVIIATQMMESMITNSSPTRAEVNDIANSVMDGADALMLSGETSVGAFPVDAVLYMQKIIEQVETYENIYYKHYEPEEHKSKDRFITDVICYNTCNIANQSRAEGIVALTHSGYAPIKLSSFRPKAAIFAFTNHKALISKLNLIWGVRSFYYDQFISCENTINDINNFLLKEGYIRPNSHIINIYATPIEEKGKTNAIKISKID